MATDARPTRRGAVETTPADAVSAGRTGGGLRDEWPIVAALAAAHVLLAALLFDPTPHTGGDNAGYIALARSLLERGEYLELWRPAVPVHTKYPPVFPAMVALGMLLGLEAWVGLKLIVVACSTAAVAATYLWLRRRRGRWFALGAAALVAAAPGVLHLSHWILSDVPFWALTMVALWAWERIEPGRRGPFAVAVAATALAFLTRSAGLPLIVAAGGWLALERRWRPLLAFIGVLAPVVVGWWLWGRLYGGVGYFEEFLAVDPYTPELGRVGVADLFGRIGDNGGRYLGTHLPRMLIGYATPPILAVGVGVAALALVGWVRRIRSSPAVAELFFPLYAGLLLLWPAVWAGDRFLLPLLPLVLVYAAEAVLAAARWVRPQAARAVGIAGLGLALVAMVPGLHAEGRYASRCTGLYLTGERYPCLAGPWRDFFALAEWSRDALPEDAAVISRKPRLFYALSGRPGDVFPKSPDPTVFFDRARELGARHVVLGRLGGLWQRYLAPVLQSRPERFCVVRSLGARRAALLGILPESAAADGRRGGAPAVGPCPAEFRRLR